MPLVKVKEKAQVTLPVTVRRALGIREGDYLKAIVEGNKIVLIPQTVITRLPAVTLSEEGDRILQEALAEVKAGKVKEHETVESLIEELHHEAHQD